MTDSKTVRIDAQKGHIKIEVLDPDRITKHGFGIFLTGLRDDEIEVTDAARPLVATLRYRHGVQGAEVFRAPRVIAWMGDEQGTVLATDQVSCDDDGVAWLLSCGA